jgi:hypothetical protein
MIKKTIIVSVAALALMAPASAMAQSAGKVQFLTQQASTERLASSLVGVSVQNSSGEELGDVNDLILNSNGQATGVVMGVGGCLGSADNNIANPNKKFPTTMTDNATVVVLNATKAELEAAPDFRNAEGNPVSVSKRITDQAQETYQKAKEQASDTYNKTKENVTGEKKVTQ